MAKQSAVCWSYLHITEASSEARRKAGRRRMILSDLRAVRLLSEVQGPVFREEWLLLFSSVHSAGPRDGASHWIDSELEVTDYAWSA